MATYPAEASLQGLETEIFKMVSSSASPEQWKEWLRVPLEHAAARGNLDLFDKLLGAGANGGAGWRGCDGRTLLDAAALGGNEDIVSALLRAGAQPDVNVVSASSGRSALYTAVSCGHEAVGIRLAIAGADVNFEDPAEKASILHAATHHGHAQLVSHLVMGGADLNCPEDKYGCTPLHVAAAAGHDGIVSTLLLRGAEKNALDNGGYTPLLMASSEGHLRVVKTLLAAGADFYVRGDNDCSALDTAARRGHVPVIQAILGRGADVNGGDDAGCTTLHVAALNDQADAVDALVEAGADVELKDNAGWTPLTYAARHSNNKAMLALLQHGAKLDGRDNAGNMTLHWACDSKERGVDATVDLLLRWGADETALNGEGHIPVDRLYEERYDFDNPPTQDEIGRTWLLLSRAPADRAWRRRGWLVMLRARGASHDSCGGRGDSEGTPTAAGGSLEGDGCKAAKAEDTRGGGDDHVVHTPATSGVGVARGDGDGDGGVLSGAVGLLAGLQPESVFRMVLSFL